MWTQNFQRITVSLIYIKFQIHLEKNDKSMLKARLVQLFKNLWDRFKDQNWCAAIKKNSRHILNRAKMQSCLHIPFILNWNAWHYYLYNLYTLQKNLCLDTLFFCFWSQKCELEFCNSPWKADKISWCMGFCKTSNFISCMIFVRDYEWSVLKV